MCIRDSLYVDWDFDALQELGRELAPMAKRLGVDITFSSKRYLELMPAGVDKDVYKRQRAYTQILPGATASVLEPSFHCSRAAAIGSPPPQGISLI